MVFWFLHLTHFTVYIVSLLEKRYDHCMIGSTARVCNVVELEMTQQHEKNCKCHLTTTGVAHLQRPLQPHVFDHQVVKAYRSKEGMKTKNFCWMEKKMMHDQHWSAQFPEKFHYFVQVLPPVPCTCNILK